MKNLLIYNKGITLIALVITIIVLLILAGVSITMLTGNNGILTQAQNAKKETEEAQEDELRKLTALEAVTNLSNTTYKDKNEQTVTIPAGFAVSKVEGENTVEDGLVIIDSNENEFVWIPVECESSYARNKNYNEADVSGEAYTDTGYLPDEIQPDIDEAEYNEKAERKAVIEAGGFFISRFEAGNENGQLVSKKGVDVYNYVSQEESKEKSKKFVNNKNVKSALCSGIQWDVVMDFVNGKNDAKGEKFDILTPNANRHTDIINKTGQNDFDKVCNIYDLEGNCIEFVAEKTSYTTLEGRQYIFLDRGGSSVSENSRPASFRRSDDGDKDPNISFRFVLYLM